MNSHTCDALRTQPFEATRTVLNVLDTIVFDPLCQIEGLATAPRIVQIAFNTLGIIDGAISSAVLCLVCCIPLPEAFSSTVRVWRDDAWTLTCQLADKIARLIIASIPLVGAKILSCLDHSLAANARLSGEIYGLRATGIVHDEEIARTLKTIEDLRHEINTLSPHVRTCEQLRRENADLTQLRDMLTQKIDALVESHTLKEAAAEKTAGYLQNLEARFEEEKHKIVAIRQELETTREILEQTVSQCRDGKATNSSLEDKIHILLGRISDLEQENKRMHTLRNTSSPH
jgi:hypothetical protein